MITGGPKRVVLADSAHKHGHEPEYEQTKVSMLHTCSMQVLSCSEGGARAEWL